MTMILKMHLHPCHLKRGTNTKMNSKCGKQCARVWKIMVDSMGTTRCIDMTAMQVLHNMEEIHNIVTTPKVALKEEEEAMEELTSIVLAIGAPNTILSPLHMVHMGITKALIKAVQVKKGLNTILQFFQLLEILTMEIMDKEVCQVDMDTMTTKDHMAVLHCICVHYIKLCICCQTRGIFLKSKDANKIDSIFFTSTRQLFCINSFIPTFEFILKLYVVY